jgi:hypothetical protein
LIPGGLNLPVRPAGSAGQRAYIQKAVRLLEYFPRPKKKNCRRSRKSGPFFPEFNLSHCKNGIYFFSTVGQSGSSSGSTHGSFTRQLPRPCGAKASQAVNLQIKQPHLGHEFRIISDLREFGRMTAWLAAQVL